MHKSFFFFAGILVVIIAILLGFMLAVFLLSSVGIDTDVTCHMISETEAICGIAFEKINHYVEFVGR